jgi:O-antigen/teichoic acid export membrane protein
MSLLKKLAGETALYGLSSIAGRFINYIVLTPLHTRVFTPGEYGVVGELYAWSGFLMVLFSYRMESGFFRFGNDPEQRNIAYSTGLISLLASTLGLLALFLALSGTIAGWLHYERNPEYIQYFAFILALDCLSELPFAQLRLTQRPMRFVMARLLNIGVNVVLNLFWLLYCPWAAQHGQTWVHAVWSPGIGVGYVFLANLISSAVMLLFLSPQIFGIQFRFDRELWKKMVLYSAPLIISGLAGIVNETLDRAMMTRLLTGTVAENKAQLGIYSANYKLAMLITLFTQAYRYAAEPFFFRTAQNADALKIQANTTKWFTIAGSMAMLAILLFLDVLKFFLGNKYHSGLDIVPILLLANLFLGLFYNFSVWYRLKDRTATGAWIAIAGASITLLLNIWWVPIMGYMGAAWATLVCYLFMSGTTWYLGRKIHPVPYPLLRIGLFIGGALLLYGVSVAIRPLLPSLGVILAINTLIFGLYLAWVVREYKTSEI